MFKLAEADGQATRSASAAPIRRGRELDEAVNESARDEEGEAMSAFFEGGEEEQGRGRFGWRR